MFLIWLLLFLNVIKSAQNTTHSVEYPSCDNNILFVIATSFEVDTVVFQKQIDFLENFAFEKWNHFGNVAFLTDGDLNHTNFGFFDSKAKLKNFIRNTKQIESSNNICNVFFQFTNIKMKGIVIFLDALYASYIYDYCEMLMINYVSMPIAFVVLSEKVDPTPLTFFLDNIDFIEWETDSETPTNWFYNKFKENHFNRIYQCGDYKTTTTMTSFTTEHTRQALTTITRPPNPYPCGNDIAIVFDKSNDISNETYQFEQEFLVDYVFKNWTRFNTLFLFSYANYVVERCWHTFRTTTELKEFVLNQKQINATPDLCNLFDKLKYPDLNYVVFLSSFNVTDSCEVYNLQRLSEESLTFVLLNDNMPTDTMREFFPQAQFIKLYSLNVPAGWEWHFQRAYGCENDNVNDQIAYPCNNKFIFAYEVSSELNSNTLNAQSNFLKEHVFNNDWNVFNNLALIAYSNETIIQDFGTLNDLNSIHSFIDNSTNQNENNPVSLCDLFKTLTTMYLFNVNVVIFASTFHNNVNDECAIWLKQLRINSNYVRFVNLTHQMDVEYLLSELPQSSFTSWNVQESKKPDIWGLSSYGCEDFTVNEKTYPCDISKININIVYERSRFLSLYAYQRLANFLSTRFFIKEWSYFDSISLYTYPNDVTDKTVIFEGTKDLNEFRLFIRQHLKSLDKPLLCPVLNYIYSQGTKSDQRLILFVSKFDEQVLPKHDEKCRTSVSNISNTLNITFIKLGRNVNVNFLNEIFPKASIVSWDIEEVELPWNWNQIVWGAIGCVGQSTIILPPNKTSTTQSLTARTVSKNAVTSTTQTAPTTTSNPVTFSTTIPTTTSSKSSKEQNKSNEKAIYLGIFIPIIFVFLVVIIVGVLWCKRRNRQNLVDVLAAKDFRIDENEYEKEFDPWEVNLECLNINFMDTLGSGAFGDVYLGKLVGPAPITQVYNDSPHCQRFKNCEVAIKTLPAQSDEYARNEFEREIEFMKGLKFHQNVVCMLGYVSDYSNPLMIMEYCSNGDLLHFIKSNKQKFVESQEENTDSKTLTSFAWQISSGLEYLGSLGLIHRDIAARNILLDKNNVCKISDFGLCRTSTNQLYLSSGGKLPVKWMATESLKDNVFSNKTDVWSYGILLWELFTLGQIPYAHVDNVLTFLDSGQRLDKPQYCTNEIYDLMASCWLVDPEERPTFTIICQLLAKMIESATMHYNYVDTLALIEEANIIEEINE